MARPARNVTPIISAADQHRGWLELVDTEGPFLAIPPLKRVWPQGMPNLSDEHKAALIDVRKDFESAWEALDRTPDREATLDAYRIARDKWVETVLRDVAGWAESLSWGEVPGIKAQSPNRAITVTAQAALDGSDGIGALVHLVDPVDSLRQTPGDLWAATPVDRMEALLRENQVEIGIVTDGRWWGLVCAREGNMAASGIVDALTWIEEPRTRDAFLTLIGRQHIIGGDPAERLPALFEDSIAAAEEITEALGAQVRRAVELLIQSFSESAADAKRRGLPDPLPARTHETYEAAVTVMMRTVFLLFAEERALLPSGELFEQGYGISGELDRLMGRETEESEEALDATSLTWHRLLATSRALYSGASFESLRMPAYGGSLFEPDRFPFLTATNEQGALAVTVSDRVMLHVLRSVQLAVLKGGEARQISFRDIDVEQIGYIYEGLLGYTCATVGDTYLGLLGSTGVEPEIPLAKLEELAEANVDRKKFAAVLIAWLAGDQPSAKPPSVAAIAKTMTAEVDPSVVSALTQAVGDDLELRDRVRPWLGLIRLDLRQRPFVVLDGGLLVTETPSRKNAGAHYTPKSLAEEVVLHTLQPLCYSPGPHQTAAESEWKLKSSDELLDLKVADIACGSGAFLVAAARYLADRLVEAWTAEDKANASRKDLHLRAIRQVVANCLYGADINDMAVEMCKLSLWLVSLDRDLPFSFVDDKIFHGNSLLGLTSLKQLQNLHIDGAKPPKFVFAEEFDVDIDSVTRKAVDLRRVLATPVDDSDPARSGNTKKRQLTELLEVTTALRRLADGVIAAGLMHGGIPGRALDDAYDYLRVAAKQSEQGLPKPLDEIIARGLKPTVPTDYQRWKPLHWVLEAPDIFVEHGGFDAIVGNPPFLRVSAQSSAMGENVRNFVVENVAGGDRGMADFVAYFYRRAAELMRPDGSSMGLIATNSIAQNHSSRVGIAPLLDQGFSIRWAIKSEPWPVEANFHYSLIVMSACEVPYSVLDRERVPGISPILEIARRGGLPHALAANDGLSFEGSKLTGAGFVLGEHEAAQLVDADPASADVVFPYLVADDLNGRPDQSASRKVINFGTLPEERARTFGAAFSRVHALVKPQRMKSKRKSDRERWWVYGETRPGLYGRLEELDRTITVSKVSKYLSVSMCRTGQVFSDRLIVVPDSSYARFAVLISVLHEIWAREYAGSLEDRLVYSPTSTFRTFPFPDLSKDLEIAGERFDRFRGELMLIRGVGLTELGNIVSDASVRDADVVALRQMMHSIDGLVVKAYGWHNLILDHGFYEWRGMIRFTVGPATRVEILDRLLEENHKRAAAEGPTSKVTSKGRNAKTAAESQEGLF